MSADRLCCWKSGEEGVVTGVHGDGTLSDRLQELGVVTGAWVRMVQHGSPMLIQIGNSRICLRRDDAKKVGAEVLAYNG
ncbi:MAG TPA: FeoA family protein [Planctomycetota bacterium]|nr:FeoA family protein [Planctomycetota bacterium]